MSEEVSNTQILQAITELSGDLNTVAIKVDKLEKRLTQTEKNLNDRIDRLDTKISNVDSRRNEKFDKIEANLNNKIDNVEKNLEQKICANGEKIDTFDDKLSIVTDELLSTKADVKRLKKIQ